LLSNRDQFRDYAIDKAREVVDAWAVCVASGRTIGSKAVVDIKTEELIAILLENFQGTIEADRLAQVFNSGVSYLEYEELLNVPDPMVPVAVMREVLHKNKVTFNPKNVANWREFVMRFGRYIMSA
jgi:hypothetical protein